VYVGSVGMVREETTCLEVPMDEGTDARADGIQELSDEESKSVTGGVYITREVDKIDRGGGIFEFECPRCGTCIPVDMSTRQCRDHVVHCPLCGNTFLFTIKSSSISLSYAV
jgi:predicted Zn finger-like uncharacterized protein